MKKGKRILSCILALTIFLTTCLPNVLGATNANGETEVSVSQVYSGHNGNIVTFVLSESDYGSSTAGVGSTHTEYNYWTNIKVYTDDTTYKSLGDVHYDQKYYAIWGRTNTISIQFNETDYAAATKIVIPAGTVFPSMDYTNNSSATKGGYITTSDLEFVRPSETISTQTDWVKTVPATEVETNISKIQVRDASGKLFLFLSTSDYANASASTKLGTKISEYNFLDYIVVYKSDTEYKTLSEIYGNEGYYNLWGETGAIALDMTEGWDGTTIKKVVIKAGCQFPSYEYVNNSSETKNAYTVKSDTTFTTSTSTTNNTSWTRAVAPTEVATSISKIQVRDASGKLLIFPTVHDYTNAGATKAISSLDTYNILDYIVVYKSDTEYKTLSELYGGEKYYNIWGETGCVAIDMIDGWDGTTITKIVIKEGCQFPSYEYTNNGALTNTAYVVQEEMIYTTNTSAVGNEDWTLLDTSVPTEISVTGVKSGHNEAIVTFTLSDSDYDGLSTEPIGDKHTAYNYWSNIKIYTSATEYKTLGDAYTNQKYYNMWGAANTVNIELDAETYVAATKIVIPAGTVFPSAEYTNNSSSKKAGFVTTSDITYVRPEDAVEGSGYAWNVYVAPTDVDTTISKIQVRNGKLLVFLSAHDYTDIGATKSIGDKLSDYNILSNIELSTETETKTLAEIITSERYYNIWGETGSVAFSLASGWDGTTIKKVTIKAGSEFPAYAYTSGETSQKASYILQEDITFTTNTSAAVNEDWSVYYEPIVNSTEVDTIQVRDGKLLVFLTNHDYANVSATTPIGSLLSQYNLLNNIVVSTASESKVLADIVTEERYYNVWGETGSVAFGLASGYDGTTITKVAIKEGSEFPAYIYTSGEAKAKTSYVLEKDYVYTTGKTAAVNTDWTKVEARTIEVTAESVQNAHNGHHLTVTLSKSDYAGCENTSIGDNHTDYNYWTNVRIYSDDTTYTTLADSYLENGQKYYNMWSNANSISIELTEAIDNGAIRVVIPAGTVFPCYNYTKGEQAELSGYEITHETIFELIDGVWTDVSLDASKVSADVRGDGVVDSRDLVCMKKYLKNGYRHNETADCDVDGDTDTDDLTILREVLLGRVLHNYVKESESLPIFSSSDMALDSFLNDYFKRQVGYVDYEEGDMSVTSVKPGKSYMGIFNQTWNTMALTWFNSADSLESDRTTSLKEQIESIPVDRYGYVWDGMDTVEDPTTGIGKGHSMGWPFPNAAHTNQEAKFWEFNDDFSSDKTANQEMGCTWTNTFGATAADGLYKGSGTATDSSSITFEVKDYALVDSSRTKIVSVEYAPWLAIDLRMYNVVNPENIDDIYVSYTTSRNGDYITVKASDIAALTHDFAETYEHVLYLPMYGESAWNSATDGIFKIKIEIRAKSGTTFSGDFALNYVRPSFDTRHSNNNGNYISSLKEYYSMTGDVEFVKENITKARKAMNFYLQMYDADMQLNNQTYLYGHGGSKTELATGLGNGYWDILYTPQYDFQSNMYFYRALEDLAYLEDVLVDNGITVSTSAAIQTVTTSTKGTSTYIETISTLNSTASNVKAKMQSYFWNETTGRYMAGLDNDGNKVDYGYTMWNLEAIELGIATTTQETSIMDWMNGDRTVAGDTSTGTDLYAYGFAPRTATVNDEATATDISGIFGAFVQNGFNTDISNQAFGDCVQFGGSVMYSSYYDLMSRISVKGADNAFTRLKGIQSWYEGVSDYYKNNDVVTDEFYLQYFLSKGITPQNGAKGYGNGAVGIDGEFTESLLTLAAIPYGFFGIDTDDGKCLSVAPSLPSTLDYWKIENMAFNGATYDVSIYEDAVRIDSVRGETSGLTIAITLDCPEGKKVYVNGEETDATITDGKVTVTVEFEEVIIEVK